MLRRALLPLALLLAVASAVAAERPPVSAKPDAALDRTWRRLESRAPDSGARDIYGFLLTAVAQGWHPERWAAVIALGEELHDRDPSSPTYGNYRWYWREPKPNDRNAVEFSMQSASLAWAAYRDRFPADAADALQRALTLGAEGLRRHKVDVSYTNIFLMRAANAILIGETTNRPELAQDGRQWLAEWFAYTAKNGVHEFSSPTYYGTDLTDLGALARLSPDPATRSQAEKGLRLLWTDIAAHWFAPHEGISGAHSRDYGFLVGHGYLDQQLLRAGWITRAVASESHAAIDDVTFWRPPATLEALAHETPRTIVQRWGANPWERATLYVGGSFALGSSGAGYGAQDKTLALTFSGGPTQPIAAFSLDYRGDPYGQRKMGTADGHSKLTHLLPFVASVQRGPEVLLLDWYDPAHSRNPAGGRAPIEYAGVDANLVLPANALLSDARGPLPAEGEIPLSAGAPVFVRFHDTLAAITIVATENDAGQPAPIAIVRDGAAFGAQRLTARLATGRPRQPVWVAIWIRAAEGTDASLAAFRNAVLSAAAKARVTTEPNFDVTVAGATAPLRIVADPAHDRRLRLDGGDAAAAKGILVVNGRDLGGEILGGH